MASYFKKYWIHLLNIIYLIAIILCALKIKYISISVIAVLSLGIIIEIIYYLIIAIRNPRANNNVLHAILICFFNIFYIPCYKLQYVDKDKNYKIKNTIYLILSILLYIVFIFLLITFSKNELNYKIFNSKDKAIRFKLPSDYYQKDTGEYDLYFTNGISNIGVFIYNGIGYNDDEVLDNQENFLLKTRDNTALLNSYQETINNKTIKTHTIEGSKNGVDNIYILSTITFSKSSKIVYVVEIVLKDDYNHQKEQLHNILTDIDLIK